MTRKLPVRLLVAGFALTILASTAVPTDEPTKATSSPTVAEARERARLLHGTIHDTLQLVHAQYYREDEGLMIPAASLKHLFQGVEQRSGVGLRWLVVEGRAMNIDHNPRDAFEKEAVIAISTGKDEHELAADGVYRYAGPITLRAECLKCHLPSRTSNKSRKAGLLISIPVGKR